MLSMLILTNACKYDGLLLLESSYPLFITLNWLHRQATNLHPHHGVNPGILVHMETRNISQHGSIAAIKLKLLAKSMILLDGKDLGNKDLEMRSYAHSTVVSDECKRLDFLVDKGRAFIA